jgi:ribonuclease-3
VSKHLEFSPNDTILYEQAFRHSSASKRNKKGIKNSNERLEFLGDAVLDLIVARYLYDKFPKLEEGQLTKMKAKVVSRRTLNSLGERIDLPQQLELNLGKQVLHQSIIGNAFEALVGAVFLDTDYDFTEKVFLKLLKKNNIDEMVHLDVDFKSKLHEYCQKDKISLTFAVVEEQQEAGKSFYEIEVRLDGRGYGRGSGKSKKSAEQTAARAAWEQIESN